MTMKLILSLIFAFVAAWGFSARQQEEQDLFWKPLKKGRKTVLLFPLLLPCFLLLLLCFQLFLPSADFLSPIALILLGYLSLYFALLLLLLPLLRRFFSAKACASLWLLPNLLYLLFNLDSMFAPRIILPLPFAFRPWMVVVWLGGFVLMLLWQTVTHLRFRHRVLKDAVLVTDEKGLRLWQKAQEKPANRQKKFLSFSGHLLPRNTPVMVEEETLRLWRECQTRSGCRWEILLLRSPVLATPLTLGLFDRTLRLVLPQREYTLEELELIFCHEVGHIRNEDIKTKALLFFSLALGWFNPLIWLVCCKVAQDLELSCDEGVLYRQDDKTRRKYAALLLHTVGSSLGLTSCLSASGRTLRYRLRRVLHPGKKLSGALLLGLSTFFVMMSYGSIALAQPARTADELIFQSIPSGSQLTAISQKDGFSSYRSIYAWEEEGLTDYLKGLSVEPLLTTALPEEDWEIYITFSDDQSATRLTLSRDFLTAYLPYDNKGAIYYKLTEPLGKETLFSFLDPSAPDPDPDPTPPTLDLFFDHPELRQTPLSASRTILSESRNGILQEERPYWRWEGDPSGIKGFPTEEVRLGFSLPCLPGGTILVQQLDEGREYSLPLDGLVGNALPLAPYSARYTITASFSHPVQNTVYEAQFCFDVRLP